MIQWYPMKTVSIIIPVYNEQDRIAKALSAVIKAKTPGYIKEIIIVNDGSTDKTSAKIKNQISKLKQKNTSDQRPTTIGLTTIDLKTNMGKGAALKAGIRKAKGDVLLVQDADLEYSVDDYPALLVPFSQGAKVVYGTRNKMRKEFNTKYSTLPFYWGGIILTWIVNALFGTRLTDQATGYKLFHKDLKELLLTPREDRFAYEVAVTGLVSDAGYTIHEVPIHYSPRKSGEGKKIKAADFISSVMAAIKHTLLTKSNVLNHVPLFIGIGLVLFFWRNTLFSLSSSIHDWYDGAFMIWTMQNNIKHFAELNITRIYETNAMYPFTNTLSFTDHLYIPSLIATLVSFISPNPLLQFNVVSILNHILVLVSMYILASRFTHNRFIQLIGAFYASFGPYFFSQFGHLQMIFLWPTYFSLYFLFNPEGKIKNFITAGFFMGLQLLTGVYLALMGVFIITLFFIISATILFLEKNYVAFIRLIKNYSLLFLCFVIVASPSIYGYIRVNSEYQPQRHQGEFVTYSAHISDYLLNIFNNSLFNSLIFNPLIGNLNRHYIGEPAAFIGFMPLIILIASILISFGRFKKYIFRPVYLWCLSLIVIGFIFSLGPRLNWNGEYLVTPLPYWLVMKLLPPIAIMRAVSRWYFIVILGINILLILGLNKLKLNRLTLLAIIVFFVFEFYVAPVRVESKNWITPSYLSLRTLCLENPGAVLEYPFEYRYKSQDIGKYLALKTNTLMASTLHSCPTLSGFSSFEPPLFKKWQEDFDTNGITDTNLTILKKYNFKYIRINKTALTEDEVSGKKPYIHTSQLSKMYEDSTSIIYLILYER